MRLFQIKITPIEDYRWTLGSPGDKYHDEYADRRAEAAIKIKARAQELAGYGIIVDETVGDYPVVVTATQMVDLTANAIKFELVRELKRDDEDATDLSGVMRKFNRMAARLLSLPGLQHTETTHTAQNERCHVHMPGQALATYNEVLLMENTCSDELQTALDKGWRMIAACPQPDSRRPDYVLGRFNPQREHQPCPGALRSPE